MATRAVQSLPSGVAPTLLAWSSGKDSAWALEALRSAGAEIAGLFTTYDETTRSVAMHGAQLELAEAQARAIGLPLTAIPLPWPCPNAEYEARMRAFCEKARRAGVTKLAFGDLFLDDIRAYRETSLAGAGLEPLFPLWGRPTDALAREMIAGGLVAYVVCIDPKKMPRAALGRRFDAAFLDTLPSGVDPCGENGEFHTLVTNGPMFRYPLAVQFGNIMERDGFWRVGVELGLEG